MSRIQVLDKNTIDKIAAGEVVERPSSVVKELVENALDAKATAITVEIKDGGIRLIRITDNGSGIQKDDIKTAFLRHATSKIKSAEDLLAVSSLGFRGEALSSIGAVSQVELITKTQTQFSGCRYRIEGGNEIGLEEVGAPDGTTFLVRNLFYNVPARRKFLKSAQTEAGYISTIMERMALSRPDVSFKFIQNNQTKLQTSGNTNLKDIIYHVYGRDITSNLIPIDRTINGVSLTGFIGKPLISRGNRSFENYFVNGRYVKSKVISAAIEEGYRGFVMQHKYPFTVLNLSMDGRMLDVNVHPTKMELRISNQEDVYRFICMAVRDALNGRELIPKVSVGKEENVKTERIIEKSRPEPFEKKRLAMELKDENSALIKDKDRTTMSGKIAESTLDYGKKKTTVEKEESSVLPVTDDKKELPQSGKPQQEFAKQHIQELQQQPKELQRQAELCKPRGQELQMQPKELQKHELQEELCKPQEQELQQQSKEPQTQQKQGTQQQIQEQKPKQMELFETNLLGADARPKHKLIGQLFQTYWLVEFEDNLFIIDQHAAHEKVLYERNVKLWKEKVHTSQMVSPPIILTLSNKEVEMLETYQEYLRELGFEIEHFGGKEFAICGVPGNLYGLAQKDVLLEFIDSLETTPGKATPEIITDKLATMSCKAAVKGNQRLSFQEMNALIDELMTLENPYNCPHGRPTIISMSKYDIEKKFKRIV